MSHAPVSDGRLRGETGQRGSALILAVFVLVVVTGMGIALLILSQNEVKMSQASTRSSKAFFLAEAGLEDGRATLYAANGTGSFAASLSAAAGANGVIDFDPQAIRAVYDAANVAIGFTGYGDDVPLRGRTEFGDGSYIAFLTNDPSEGQANLSDANARTMITAVGVGHGKSLELVQAVVAPDPILPSLPPCNIMLLGPSPDFDGGQGICVGGDGGGDGDDDDDSGGSGG